MPVISSFYKIKNVKPLENMALCVTFENGDMKRYDVRQAAERWPALAQLKDVALFRAVRVDVGGYGISWNDELDLACNELWANGQKMERGRETA